MEQLLTIGVYEWDLESFLAALRQHRVELLADVRQRRGVRGARYAWANSRRLQAALQEAEVGYVHLPQLAPTTELRQLQYAVDAHEGVGKRSRQRLADEYARRYMTEILDRADLDAVAAELAPPARVALLCVERDPEACHRSLAAERLAALTGAEVRHLLLTP